MTRTPLARVALALVLVVLQMHAHVATASPSDRAMPIADELRVKAAFVVSFPKFVAWPASAFTSPGQPFSLVILGDDLIATALEAAIRDVRIGSRHVEVSRVWRPSELPPSHLVYVGESEERRLDEVVKALAGTSALTVGNFRRFAERGGMIELFVRDGKVKFTINNAAAARADLAISSRLLSLAASLVQP